MRKDGVSIENGEEKGNKTSIKYCLEKTNWNEFLNHICTMLSVMPAYSILLALTKKWNGAKEVHR